MPRGVLDLAALADAELPQAQSCDGTTVSTGWPALSCNDGEAEDVVQEAYVRAFSNLATFRDESSLATWLSRIALNERTAPGREAATRIAEPFHNFCVSARMLRKRGFNVLGICNFEELRVAEIAHLTALA